jgi:hypothetical protein
MKTGGEEARAPYLAERRLPREELVRVEHRRESGEGEKGQAGVGFW